MKIYRCQHCNFTSVVRKSGTKNFQNARNKMGQHYDIVHKELLPPDMDGYRWFYYLLTNKMQGSCVECHKETDFNKVTMKYARFCNDPACKQKYKERRDNRMIGKYGKPYLLDDPEMQKKMQQGRKIAGKYAWSDGKTYIPYLSSYELDFFKHLDVDLNWPVSDLVAPSPHTYVYEYEGKKHFYMPDAFIPSLNLEVELKSSVRVDFHDPKAKEKDKIKFDLMNSLSNIINFILILDKNYDKFHEIIKEE